MQTQPEKMKIQFPDEVEGIVRVCEFFGSIQGEGIHTGAPSIFVRFSGCDMRCAWCDTRFSSWWANDYEKLTYEDIVARCIEIREKTGCKHIICTGGEPTIQPKGLIAICKRLQAEGFFTTMESNGNNFIPGLDLVMDFCSLSPKLPPGANQAWTNPKSVAEYCSLFGPTKTQQIMSGDTGLMPMPRIHLKWVISKQEDLDYLIDWVYPKLEKCLSDLGALQLPENEYYIKGFKVKDFLNKIPCILQPDGYTESLAEYAKRGAWLAELICVDGPNKYVDFFRRFETFRVMQQNHRVWWNNERRK